MQLKMLILRNAFSLKATRYIRRKTNSNIIRNAFQVIVSPVGEFKYLFSGKQIHKSYQYKIGVVCIIKNEADYIEEWIAFHLVQGVEKIILYDNGSTDSVRRKIRKYEEAGLVDFIPYPGKKLQCDVYNDAIMRYRDILEYMAIIDADEFLFPTNVDDSIVNILDDVFSKSEKIGGCIVNWLCYGSSGHKTKQEGFVIANYINRGDESFEANMNYKTIVRPDKVFSYVCPHYPYYYKGIYAVNSAGRRVNATMEKGDYSRLRINHYFTKSYEEYVEKMKRGKADQNDKRGVEDFYRHDVNDIVDNSAVIYLDKIQSLIERYKCE